MATGSNVLQSAMPTTTGQIVRIATIEPRGFGGNVWCRFLSAPESNARTGRPEIFAS
jgi:hypothetical protein